MNPIWEGANGQSCKVEKRRAFWKVIGQSFFQSRTFTFHFASWEGSGSSRFSHLALRRPPSQQLQFLRKTDQIHPPRPPKKKKKHQTKFWAESNTPPSEHRCFQLPTHQILFLTVWLLRRNLLRLYFYPSKEANSVEAPSTGNDNSTERVFHVSCFCCFPVRVSSGWRRGAEGSTVASQQHGHSACCEFTWLHVLVSARLLSRHSCVLPQPKDKNVFAHRHRHTVRMVRAWTVVGLFCVDCTGQLSGV